MISLRLNRLQVRFDCPFPFPSLPFLCLLTLYLHTDARIYFYHHILHDWSDAKCLSILAALKPAMEPGYSRLLLHEMIVPEQGASMYHALLDLTMMVFNGGMERTRRQWRDLLGRAGFEVLGVWESGEEGADGIVEVGVREE